MGLFDTVVTSELRPLPVFALVDVSGSMQDNGKIDACNQAFRDMLLALKSQDDVQGEYQLAIITFGGSKPELHLGLTPVHDVPWTDMAADGGTPLGAALQMAADMIEDTDVVPRRSYSPAIVVLSDGEPTDDWKSGLDALNQSSRASRAMRLAVAIQSEPGDKTFATLSTIAGGADHVYPARDAGAIPRALEWVTLSLSQRGRSQNPNELPPPPPKPDFDDL